MKDNSIIDMKDSQILITSTKLKTYSSTPLFVEKHLKQRFQRLELIFSNLKVDGNSLNLKVQQHQKQH